MNDSSSLHARLKYRTPSFVLDVDVRLPGRGISAIFGKSGAGKTTLLRCLAGLEASATGELRVSGEVWQDAVVFVPAHKRRLGYVFQESSLLPHLTAAANLRYGLKRAGRRGWAERYHDVVELMGIGELLKLYPQHLSGGERQRVAIARALLVGPRLLLLDEPLASLDHARKQEVLPWLENLPREFDLPVLYVTHALDEVARLASHLLVLDGGRATANGPLPALLNELDLPIQAGEEAGVIIDARITERDPGWHLLRTRFEGGDLWVRDNGDGIGDRLRLRILARDVSLALGSHEDSSIINRIPARVTELHDDSDPATLLVKLEVGATPLIARISRRSAAHLQIGVGKEVWAQIKSVAILR